MPRFRVTAPRPGEQLQLNKFSGEGSFEPILNDLMENSSTQTLDPSSCIPLFLTRPKSTNAVRRLMNIFDGKLGSSALPGMISGAPTSIVVPLIDGLYYIIREYFISQGISEDEVQEYSSKHERWYGIVDGCHFHCAVKNLIMINSTKWIQFKWRVIVISSDRSMSEYRQLARLQNERNKATYHHETTIFELLSGLRLEYDLLYSKALKNSRTGHKGVKIKHRDVAHMFDGCDHTNNTYVKQAVSVASRISPRTIEAIGEVCNHDCSDIILKDPSLNSEGLRTLDEIISQKDCRLFRRFICFGTLRASKSFMSAVADGQEEAQVNCIYRLRHWSECQGFKSVPNKVVVEQFNFSILALNEERKFLELLESDEWPSSMEITRTNVLRTTLCDMELSSNAGNDTDILPLLWESFKRAHPGKARSIEKSFYSSDGIESTQKSSEPNDTEPISKEVSCSEADELEAKRKKEEEEMKRKEDERRRIIEMRKEADKNLEESGVFLSNHGMKSFLTEKWSTDSKKIDLIVSSISRNEDIEVLKVMPSFCKKVLNPGSYCLFILSQYQFNVLEPLFKEQSFKTLDTPYLIVYDKSTLQRRAIVDFLQKQGDISLLVRMPGRHPSGYSPVFCDTKMKSEKDDVVFFASVLNVKAFQNKLKYPKRLAAIRKDEKSTDLFKHIIRMLSPPGGIVMDPIGGTFTCALACLDSGRGCVSMEEDYECFRYSVGRARIFATPGTSTSSLEEFSEDAEEQNKQMDSSPSLNGGNTEEPLYKNQKLNPIAFHPEQESRPSTEQNSLSSNPRNVNLEAVPVGDTSINFSQSVSEKDGIDALLKLPSTS